MWPSDALVLLLWNITFLVQKFYVGMSGLDLKGDKLQAKFEV